MTTYAEADKARKKLTEIFLLNAGPVPCSGVAMARNDFTLHGDKNDKTGYTVCVGLEREPTAEEEKQLPKTIGKVPVKYVVAPFMGRPPALISN